MVELAHVLVTGLVRNAEKTLRADIARLQSALQCFATISWFIVESDSDDASVATLETLTSEIPDFRYVSLGKLRDKMPLRTARLAHCRNSYLDELAAYPDVNYVAIADLDGINTLLDEPAISSCFERGGWDVCTANQRGPYYDIWALRHPAWCPGDCWQEYETLKASIGKKRARQKAVYSKMIRLSEDSDWPSVESAFGGFALYRRDAFGIARYDGRQTSEHVALHAAMRAGGKRIAINPRLINAAYTPHTQMLRPWHRLINYFKRA